MSKTQVIVTTLNSITSIVYEKQKKKETLRQLITSLSKDTGKVGFNSSGTIVYLEKLSEDELIKLHNCIDVSDDF